MGGSCSTNWNGEKYIQNSGWKKAESKWPLVRPMRGL
jgi:hypothetical protein